MTENTIYTARQAFARDVLVVAVSGGINRWARGHGYLIDCPPEDVRAEGVDPRDDRSLSHVGLADIQRAINKLTDFPGDCFAPDSGSDPVYRQAIPTLLRSIRAELERDGYPLSRFYTERIDAPMTDLVFQVAVADEVI